MKAIKGFLGYLKHLLIHRWWVMIECFNEGLYWQGLTHDLSKFLPSEMFAYIVNWHMKKNCKQCKHDLGDRCDKLITRENDGSTADVCKEYRYTPFDYAWLHHQHYNKHHWNYWVVDQNNKRAVKMPRKYMMEMICDWRAMGKKFGDTAKSFYLRSKDKMVMHPDTRAAVEVILGIRPNPEISHLVGGST